MALFDRLAQPAAKLALGSGAALAVVLACLACGYGGYRHGSAVARAAGEAKVAALAGAEAQARADAEAAARAITNKEIARGDALASELAAARESLAAQRRAITDGRIRDASHAVAAAAGGGCTFGADWVRLWNAASGLGDGDSAGAQAADGADGASGAVPAARAGVLQVTPADVLANHRDNMAICRDLAARYAALAKWAKGLPDATANTAPAAVAPAKAAQ